MAFRAPVPRESHTSKRKSILGIPSRVTVGAAIPKIVPRLNGSAPNPPPDRSRAIDFQPGPGSHVNLIPHRLLLLLLFLLLFLFVNVVVAMEDSKQNDAELTKASVLLCLWG